MLKKNAAKVKQLFFEWGFTLEKEEQFSSFGDTLLQFEKAMLRVQTLSDKGTEFVEIGTLNEAGNWYDFGLLKAIILESDDKVLEAPCLESDLAFLFEQLDKIERLLMPANLAHTKTRIKNLKAIRARRMFPEWY